MGPLEEWFLERMAARGGGEPEPAPDHLAALISDILRLDVLKEAGATFSYPDALTPIQWAGLAALTSARRRHQEKESESRQREQERQAAQAKLAKLSHGR